MKSLKVMLHGTIRNDDFLRNTALQCWNIVGTIRNNRDLKIRGRRQLRKRR